MDLQYENFNKETEKKVFIDLIEEGYKLWFSRQNGKIDGLFYDVDDKKTVNFVNKMDKKYDDEIVLSGESPCDFETYYREIKYLCYKNIVILDLEKLKLTQEFSDFIQEIIESDMSNVVNNLVKNCKVFDMDFYMEKYNLRYPNPLYLFLTITFQNNLNKFIDIVCSKIELPIIETEKNIKKIKNKIQNIKKIGDYELLYEVKKTLFEENKKLSKQKRKLTTLIEIFENCEEKNKIYWQ